MGSALFRNEPRTHVVVQMEGPPTLGSILRVKRSLERSFPRRSFVYITAEDSVKTAQRVANTPAKAFCPYFMAEESLT